MNTSTWAVLKRVTLDDAVTVERRLWWGAGVGVAVGAVATLGSWSLWPALVAVLSLLTVALTEGRRAFALLALVPTLVVGSLVLSPRVLAVVVALLLGLFLSIDVEGLLRRVATALLPVVGLGWCALVTGAFQAKYLGAFRALSVVSFGASGVFITSALALASLSLSLDGVDRALKVLDPSLGKTWRRLHAVFARLTPGARDEAQVVSQMVASRWLDAWREREEIEVALRDVRFEESREAVTRLEARIVKTEDAELRHHLEQSLRVHQDTLEQLAGLQRRVERAEARAIAEASWMETAALTLELTPRSATQEKDAVSRLKTLAMR